MHLILASIAALLVSGAAAFMLGRRPRAASAAGALGPAAACCLAALPAAGVLVSGRPESIRLPWSMPFGSAALELDALGAFFLAPILGLSALSAVFGAGYLRARRGGREAA